MLTDTEKLSRQLTGIAGEYYVAAELSRRGLIAAITLRNTRGKDILVSRPGGSVSVSVQVKTLQGKGIKWRCTDNDEESKGPHHYYVFVALNGPSGKPDYWVMEGAHVSKCVRDSHAKWLAGKRKDGTARKDSSMRAFAPGEECRERWDKIIDGLISPP